MMLTTTRVSLGLLVLLLALSAPAPVRADAGGDPLADLLPVVLPITPAEVRQLVGLLDTPDRVVVELTGATAALGDPLVALPGAFVHDVLDAPGRHLNLVHALVTDTIGLGRWLGGQRGPLFRDTVRALHRARTLTTAAALVDRLTAPENPTIRLAVVVTARANGIPIDAADVDLIRQTVLRAESADLAPVLARAVTRLIQLYGRDGVRLLLTP
jgi:hypothetical protein